MTIAAMLFSNNEPGLWVDTDPKYLYQDNTGSTPITTPGQTVGMALDRSRGTTPGANVADINTQILQNATGTKSGNGWNLTATATASWTWIAQDNVTAVDKWYRVSYAWSGNTNSRSIRLFVGGSWIDLGSSLSNSGTAMLLQSSSGSSHVSLRGLNMVAGETIYLEISAIEEIPGNHLIQPTAASRPTYGRMPKRGVVNILTGTDTLATQTKTVTAAQHTLSFTGTGSVTLSGAATGTLAGTGASNRVSLSFTPTAGDLTLTVSDPVTLAQLQLGAAFDSYQAVGNTIYDVTEGGQQTCHYLAFDGVDDCLYTAAALDLTSTDKATVLAGVRKESDAAAAIVAELSADANTNAGAWYMAAPASAVANFGFLSGGTLVSGVSQAGHAAPISAVVTGEGSISSDLTRVRVNQGADASSAADQGLGNYGSYPLYVGRRGNASLPITGKIFSLVVHGAATADVGPAERSLAASTSQVGTPTLLTAPTISGTAQSGQTLTSSTGTWANSPTTYAYQWYRDGVIVSGATASSYTLVNADIGATMAVEVAASNGWGTSSPSTSVATAAVVAGPATTDDMIALFANGRKGGLYDFYRTTSLWKDTAGTTAVTTAGDIILRVDDLSGNGNHVIHASMGPSYQTDGTKRWGAYDGVDDNMEDSSVDMGGVTRVGGGVAFNKVDDLEDQWLWRLGGGAAATAYPQISIRPRNQGVNAKAAVAMGNGNNYAISLDAVPGEDIAVGVLGDIVGDLLIGYKNGTEVGRQTADMGASAASWPATSVFRLGEPGTSFEFYGRTYRAIFIADATEAEMVKINEWLAVGAGL